MELYHSPGSCSVGILILLEEIGAPYALRITDLKRGAHRDETYLALNPKGKVPALTLPDGSVLTEFPVIAFWLARSFPQAGLLPDDLDAQARVMELTEYIVSGLHMRGSVFAMVPGKFTSNSSAMEDLREHGRGIVREGLDILAKKLGSQPYFFGEFTIADAAAFYLLSWDRRIGVELPPILAAYRKRLLERSSVKTAISI